MNNLASTVIIPIPIQRQEKGKRKMPAWTPERRKRMEKAWARRRKERLRAARKEARKGKPGSRTIARPRPAYAASGPAKGVALPPPDRNSKAIEPRSGRIGTEGQADAIAYLRAATEGYEGVPTSVCLSLLALRRLLGQVK